MSISQGLKHMAKPALLALFITAVASFAVFLVSSRYPSIFGQWTAGVSVIALFIAMLIAITEVLELRELKSIAAKTNDLVAQQELDSAIRERVAKFFRVESPGLASVDRVYTCYYPHFFLDRPLPAITHGDYFALQVLTKHLGSGALDLIGVEKSELTQPPMDRSEDSLGEIFICSPAANSVLRRVLPDLEEGDLEAALRGRDLPCWFVEPRDSDGFQASVDSASGRRIAYRREEGSGVEIRPSPCESIYREHSRDPGSTRDHITTVDDLAILGRLSRDGRSIILISGIHQYGTWIAAEFLDRLLRRSSFDARRDFLGTGEVVAVIEGTFDQRLLSVGRARCEHLWRRSQSGGWEYVPLYE